ncbi:MAG: site-specific integrase [Sphingomonas sp.]|uniref:site-specific integrase n=1 Tax=Sphingomonas sp. TaxID=28214 RepID=UPI001AD24BC2|nr:site-specific integrase [Sphingomonas sp.]MBN8807806.1 site-specific integrase [Sphingomonas sp.]
MAQMLFTDIAIRALTGSEKYETFFDTKTPNFGIRCGLRSKTFIVLRGTKRERVSIGRYPDISLADARKEAKRLLAEPDTKRAPRKTFKEAKEEYLATFPDTAHKYHLTLLFNKHFPGLGSKQLASITFEEIEEALDAIEGPSARLHAFRAARAFFRWTTRPPRRYVVHSPMEGYEAPGADTKGTRTLSDAELKALWKAADGPQSRVFRLLVLWGTRSSETTAIKRSWAEGNVLTIPGFEDGKRITKNGRDHAIPLLPLAKAVLAECKGNDTYFFPNVKGDKAITGHSLVKLIRTVQEEAGLSGFTTRDIRRTFRSNMARLKVPRELCEVLINHAPAVLDEIYDRYDRLKEKRQALSKYEAFMVKLSGSGE